MKYNFITIGGATRDISFFTDQGVLIDNKNDLLRQKLLGFEYGAKIKVDKFYYSFGGGAANAAVCLANFGLKTACLTSVGADESGRAIISNLKANKIDSRYVRVDKNNTSGSSFILVSPGGERIIFGARAANRDLELSVRDVRNLKQAANIYLASLSGNWLHALKNIYSVVGDNGPSVFWNPGGQQLRAGLKKIAPFLKKTKVFFLNKDEAIELVLSSDKGKNLSSQYLNKEENLLSIIKGYGPEIVVITLGGDGVVAYDGNKTYRYKTIKDKKRIDTTGIGDVFNSSVSAGLVCFGDLDQALKLGLRNTAAKISHLGAQTGLIKKNLLRK